MTTSGISSYQLTRDEIITASVRKLGAVARGQTLDTDDITTGAQALNTLLASYRTIGMPLWARKEYPFSPTLNTSSYTIGSGQTLDTPYPVHLLEAFRVDSGGLTKIPIDIKASVDFNQLPLTPGGPPLILNYTPQINVGTLKLWPTPDSSATTSTVTLIYQRPFEYFTVSTDTMDMPEEWYNPVIYGLAVLLAPEWGISLMDRRELKEELKTYLDMAMQTGVEDGPFSFSPNRQR